MIDEKLSTLEMDTKAKRRSTRSKAKPEPVVVEEVRRKTRAAKPTKYNDSDNEEEDDEDYETAAKCQKKATRTRKTVDAKKDNWVDDESHDSVSSCEDESDQEAELKSVKLQDKDVLDFYNEATVSYICSLLSISDLKANKLISSRPYESIDDIVGQTFYIFFKRKPKIKPFYK